MTDNNVAISVRGLSKSYTIAHNAERHSTLAESVMARLRNPLARPTTETFWALKDVSFDVKKGEVVGIIGRNGAGKSTLLKILSRITEPTSGEVRLYGRVGSLLEVGTGFHPELTGRENIYLNGQILGMRRAEIQKQFDAIVDFAEVEKFIDTPVKRYSSGMYVRLAFAVAAHLESEILIVDEVLAVGDSNFQQKCLGKMDDVAKAGRTVLFVSHNMPALNALCTRAILLTSGTVALSGVPNAVIAHYLNQGCKLHSTLQVDWQENPADPQRDRIQLHTVRITDLQGKVSVGPRIGEPFAVVITYTNLVSATPVMVDLCLYAMDGTPVFESLSTTDTNWHGRPFPIQMFRSTCQIPGDLLNDGSYHLRILFTDTNCNKLRDYREVLSFAVEDAGIREVEWFGKYIGYIRPRLQWTTELAI